jgi:hypothetical protein
VRSPPRANVPLAAAGAVVDFAAMKATPVE